MKEEHDFIGDKTPLIFPGEMKVEWIKEWIDLSIKNRWINIDPFNSGRFDFWFFLTGFWNFLNEKLKEKKKENGND